MQQTIDDKGIRTILREVENILNDRPITLIDDRNNYPTYAKSFFYWKENQFSHQEFSKGLSNI